MAGWVLEELELKPTQPQIVVGVRVWAELGKNANIINLPKNHMFS